MTKSQKKGDFFREKRQNDIGGPHTSLYVTSKNFLTNFFLTYFIQQVYNNIILRIIFKISIYILYIILYNNKIIVKIRKYT